MKLDLLHMNETKVADIQVKGSRCFNLKTYETYDEHYGSDVKISTHESDYDIKTVSDKDYMYFTTNGKTFTIRPKWFQREYLKYFKEKTWYYEKGTRRTILGVILGGLLAIAAAMI